MRSDRLHAQGSAPGGPIPYVKSRYRLQDRARLGAAILAALLATPLGPRTASAQAPDTTHLVEGQVFKTRHTIINAYPYAYYTPETELAFGAGGIMTFYTSQEQVLRPSKLTLSGYYSTKGQYKFSAGPQVYLNKNQLFISGNVDYGYYVDKFWGIGNDSPDLGTEEYISKVFGLDFNVQFPPVRNVLKNSKVGVVYELTNSDIDDKKENPYLLAGDQTGSEGGVSSGLGLNWVWDSRDGIFYPTSGFYGQVKWLNFGDWLGSDFGYNRLEIDLRWYKAVKPNYILATQFFSKASSSGAPFYEVPALGGQRIMRGYYEGRYRDELLLAGQAEIRFPIKGRFGAVGFAGLGDVSPDFEAFELRDVKTTLGGGLRFAFNKDERVNLRADIGFGRSTNGVYFGLEEAF